MEEVLQSNGVDVMVSELGWRQCALTAPCRVVRYNLYKALNLLVARVLLCDLAMS